MFSVEDNNYDENSTKITIIGVGGAGGNAVNTMIANNLKDVEYLVANTDRGDLRKTKANIRLELGSNGKGHGTGMDPEKGEKAAKESKQEILKKIEGTDMIFLTAGMGGGTGTGAAPVIASFAKEKGIVTLGIVTKPFKSEGKARRINALNGLRELEKQVDALIVIPNDKIHEIYGELPVFQSWRKSDELLYLAAKSVYDIVSSVGYINIDFADISRLLSHSGSAIFGIGIASGENRAAEATKAALNNDLLEDFDLKNSRAVLYNIKVGFEVKMSEINEIQELIHQAVGDDTIIISGYEDDQNQEDGSNIEIVFLATGLDFSKILKDYSDLMDPPEKKIKDTEIRLNEAKRSIHNAERFNGHSIKTTNFSESKNNVKAKKAQNAKNIPGFYQEFRD